MAPPCSSALIRAALLGLIAAVAVAAPGPSGAGQPGGRVTCNIGAIIPNSLDKTGDKGQGVLNGAMMAIEDFSTENVTVNLITYDVGCNPAQAKEAMIKAVDVDKVQGVLGGYCSMDSLAAAKVAAEKKVPMISPTSSSPRLTDEGGPYFFRLAPSDIYQGKMLGELVAKRAKKVGIIYTTEPYGEGVAHELFVVLNKAGIPVVGAVGVGEAWVPGVMGGILEGGADSIVLAMSNLGHTKKAAMELREANFTGSFYTTDSQTVRHELVDGSERGALNGTIGIAHFTGSPAFRAKYKARFNTTVVPLGAAPAYDAIHMYLKVCAKDGKALPGSEIQPLLERATIRWGATGPNVGFDANGDPKAAKFEYYKAVNDKWEPWTPPPLPARRSGAL